MTPSQLTQAFFAAFTRTVQTGSPDPALETVVAKDYVQHEPGIPQGRDGLKAYLLKLHARIPGMTCASTDTVSDGDRVVVRTSCTIPDPKTGKTETSISADVFRIRNGQLAEHWSWAS